MPDATQPRATTAPEGDGGVRGPRWWLLPALTFLVGVALGALVLWVGTSSSRTPSAGQSVTPTTSTTTSGATSSTTSAPAATLSVPAQCLKVADDSRAVVDLVNQSVTAARDLDAAKLSDLVRQIQAAQATLQTDAETCRAAQASLPTLPSSSSSTART